MTTFITVTHTHTETHTHIPKFVEWKHFTKDKRIRIQYDTYEDYHKLL